MIFQIHEKHGKHIAYSPNEAQSNEKNGWRTVSKEEFYGTFKADDLVADIPEIEKHYKDPLEGYAELVEAHVRRFGKKPHPKAGAETIRKKLNADG